jgi:predicted nucleic acid-binding protein
VGKLIDSSVLVAAERGLLDIDVRLVDYRDEGFALSALTASELLHGVHRARDTERRVQRERFVEGLLQRLPVIPIDLLVARVHAALWADLAANGVLVGERDLLIGATAIAHAYDVVTRDQRSFPRIPGLVVVEW